MSLAILFHFLCAQHVSDINIYVIRSSWLFCWITTLAVLFLVRCVLEFRCGWVGVVSVCQAEAQIVRHWLYCSWFDVCWSFGVVGLGWYPCARLKHKLYDISCIVLGSMCVGVSVWLGWSGIRVAGCFSLQHGYHPNPSTPKLQHTSNQEQYDQCGNSTE